MIRPSLITLWGGRMKRLALIALSAWIPFIILVREAPASIHAGPILDAGPDRVSTGSRLDALGPLIRKTDSGHTKEFGLLPIWFQSSRPKIDSLTIDVLYPLFSYRKYGRERRISFVELATWEIGRNDDEKIERSTTIFPFYFRKHIADGSSDFGLLPFYGKLLNRFGRDEIRFVLFPLYSKTLKKDLVTTNIVYPFVSWWKSAERSGYQIFPFYSRDDAPGRFRKMSVLWPIFFKQTIDMDTEAPQDILLVLPFYASFESAHYHSRTILWPFFTHTINRKKGTEEWGLPFPGVVFFKGPDREIFRILPFYGREFDHGDVNKTVLWPIYIRRVSEDEYTFSSRTRILYYLIQNKRSGGREGPGYDRRVDVWPLGTYVREGEHGRRLWMLSLLEPLFPQNQKVEKIYAPFWRLFDYNRRDEDHYAMSILWNFLRIEKGGSDSGLFSVFPLLSREVDPRGVEWSFILGLIKFRREAESTRFRFLYLPFPAQESGSERAE